MNTCLEQPPFDLLSSTASESPASAAEPAARLADIATRLLEYAMDEYRSIRKLEDSLGSNRSALFDRRVAVSLRRLYDQWAKRSDSLLAQVRELNLRQQLAERFDELEDAVGRTLAMLSVTLESLDRADEQIRNGQTLSIEEVRRELRARRDR